MESWLRESIVLCTRVADPHFFADLDPAGSKYMDPDPDPDTDPDPAPLKFDQNDNILFKKCGSGSGSAFICGSGSGSTFFKQNIVILIIF